MLLACWWGMAELSLNLCEQWENNQEVNPVQAEVRVTSDDVHLHSRHLQSRCVHPSCLVWVPLIAKGNKLALVWRIFRGKWTLPLVLLTIHKSLGWAEMQRSVVKYHPWCNEILEEILSCSALWKEDVEHRKTVNEQSIKNKKVLLRLWLPNLHGDGWFWIGTSVDFNIGTKTLQTASNQLQH